MMYNKTDFCGPPRLLANLPLPQEVSRSPTATGPVQWPSVRSAAVTIRAPCCPFASCSMQSLVSENAHLQKVYKAYLVKDINLCVIHAKCVMITIPKDIQLPAIVP